MVAWLGLEFDAGGWTLTDSGGMRQILDAIDCPHRQCPSVPLFMGQAVKAQALRSLYPYHNIGRHGKVGFARLHLSSTAASYPVIVIESSHTPNSRAEPSQRGPARQYHMQNCHDWSYQDIQDLLYRRGLLPLTDVLCLFAADLGGCSGVQALLSSWNSAPLSGLDGTGSIRPRLVIVLTDPEDGPHHSAVIESALETAAMPNLAASVTVVDLRGRNQLSPASRFEPLRRQLSLELDTSRAIRSQSHLLFSAVHLEWIFRNLFRHVAHNPATPFNCIQACRRDYHGGGVAASSLHAFLGIVKQAGSPYQSVVTFIASAFLMDAYPPGMHEFNPTIVFRHLYTGPCAAACLSSTPAHVRRFCRDLEAEFALLFTSLPTSPSAQIRRAVLRREATVWATVKSGCICLFCLRRPPEHVLPCGHAMCDTCVCIFGSQARGAEYHFNLSACPACFETFSLTVRQLPPTKRPTILVLDGGGIRGVVTLGFLKALEEQIGGLREAFDLTVGTSAGAVIASDVVICGACVDEASSKFKRLARQIFPLRPRRYTFFGQSWDFLSTWMMDSRYDSDTLDKALQEAFGPSRRLFDTAAPRVSGIRVALTASQVTDGSLCLFPNYRAAGRSNTQSAHNILTSNDEPLLWEVARCSVAALGYFTPKCLTEVGTLQDGGIRANCPLRPALRESEIIWPSATRPDLVVSIGTGYAVEGPAMPSEEPHRRRHDGFIERAIRTFLSSPAVDARRGWQDALDSVPATVKKDVFRLDRAMPGKLPELDDARALDELGEFEYQIPDELVRAWLAKSLFFELDREPILVKGVYDCQGSVLCCKYDAAGIVEQIMSRFVNARFTLSEGRDLGAVNVADGCSACGYYRKHVRFQVSSMYESVHLGVHGMMGSCALGGFPTTLKDLLEAQQADSPFGRADHRCNQWPPSRRCYCTGTERKRSLTPTEPETPSKRRRL